MKKLVRLCRLESLPIAALGVLATGCHLFYPFSYTFMHNTYTSLTLLHNLALMDSLQHVSC